jgi:hypothetical protein
MAIVIIISQKVTDMSGTSSLLHVYDVYYTQPGWKRKYGNL